MNNLSGRPFSRYKYADGLLVGYFLKFVVFLDQKLETRQVAGEGYGETAWEDEIGTLIGEVAHEITSVGHAAQEEHPQLSEQTLQELMFVMSAWGDEVLIKSYRNGLIPEQHGGLERRLFGTDNAGEQFFNKAEHLVDRRRRDDVCLAAVFLTATTLGFEGRYMGDGATESLQRIVRDLRTLALDVADAGLAVSPGGAAAHPSTSTWGRGLGMRLALLLASGALLVGGLGALWSTSIQPLTTLVDGLSEMQDAAQRKQAVDFND